jgi:hypothetical protein
MAVDSRGRVWGVTLSNAVIYYNKAKKQWYDAKFPKTAINVSAGPAGQTYVLGYPMGPDGKSYTIYTQHSKSRKWSAL